MAGRDTALVSTQWLNDHLDDPDIRILEVDEDTSAYDSKRHIPGALAVNWTTDLQDPIRRDLIDPEAFARLQDRLGVTPSTPVVLYGGNNNWFAAYAYWYYKLYGHENVRLLDGGRVAWTAEERPLTDELPGVSATSGYPVPTADESLRARRDRVEGSLDDGGVKLVDVRSPEEYRGERLAPDHLPNEAAQRPGHIPGAVNIPWAKSVDAATGRFLTDDELSALYGGQGVDGDGGIIAYCRIGERSAHTWFVLHELLAYPNVRNYDGSWTEWGSLIGVPIER